MVLAGMVAVAVNPRVIFVAEVPSRGGRSGQLFALRVRPPFQFPARQGLDGSTRNLLRRLRNDHHSTAPSQSN